jgi:hypothetical protein
MADEQATRPFGRALHDLLADREEFLTGTGNVNWRLVSSAIPGMHYETLRKAIAGERLPSAGLIEQVAELAKVEPGYFVEYELARVQREFDVREVGFDQARENLRLWVESQKKRR